MIVSTDWLNQHLHDPSLTVVDVRNVTNEPDGGHDMYLAGHIPGAVFLDMDTDLADRSDLRRGRHPLPTPQQFVASLTRVGIGKGTRVIAYDNTSGSNAARLWWMMRWIGVNDAAVLDGGIAKWINERRTLEHGESSVAPSNNPLDAVARDSMIVDKRTVARSRELGLTLIDARSAARHRGDHEPIDTRAGHIPHSINVPWNTNVTGDESPVLKDVDELRSLYIHAGVSDATKAVCYCGSGVTACLDILAMELAGMRGARLYPGSWSEWISDS